MATEINVNSLICFSSIAQNGIQRLNASVLGTVL